MDYRIVVEKIKGYGLPYDLKASIRALEYGTKQGAAQRPFASAKTAIVNHLASLLPPETPPFYRSVLKARYIGSGRKRVATAWLEMFDGQIAQLEVVHIEGELYRHQWKHPTGDYLAYDRGQWKRIRGEI
jgi:hypothetical protein